MVTWHEIRAVWWSGLCNLCGNQTDRSVELCTLDNVCISRMCFSTAYNHCKRFSLCKDMLPSFLIASVINYMAHVDEYLLDTCPSATLYHVTMPSFTRIPNMAQTRLLIWVSRSKQTKTLINRNSNTDLEVFRFTISFVLKLWVFNYFNIISWKKW